MNSKEDAEKMLERILGRHWNEMSATLKEKLIARYYNPFQKLIKTKEELDHLRRTGGVETNYKAKKGRSAKPGLGAPFHIRFSSKRYLNECSDMTAAKRGKIIEEYINSR